MSSAEQRNKVMINKLVMDILMELYDIIMQTMIEMKIFSNVPDKVSLREDLHWEITEKGGIIGFKAPHAPTQEFGRMAGSHVPIASLVAWVMHKKEPGITEEQATEIAYRVENKIFEKGFKGRKFMQASLHKFLSLHGGVQ